MYDGVHQMDFFSPAEEVVNFPSNTNILHLQRPQNKTSFMLGSFYQTLKTDFMNSNSGNEQQVPQAIILFI